MAAFSAQDLCRHAGSMQALARDLLADDAMAADAVQQACLTALTRPPKTRIAIGAWLAAVVRSCALDLRRSEQRRHRREQWVAQGEVSEPSDAAERLELQQDIVGAVRSLGEPYRTAVWLRYFEERSPKQIATQLGEPVKTIKTRLWRALQLLRQKLDSRYGDRKAWLGALLPVAQASGRTAGFAAAFTVGAVLMQSKPLVIATAAVLLLVAGSVWLWPRPAAAPSAAPSPIASSTALPNAKEPLADDVAQRLEVADAAVPAPPPTQPYGALLVQVRWHDGSPAGDVAITFLAKEEPQLDRNEVRVVADTNGIARVDALHAGPVTLTSDRGGSVTAEVVAGASRDVEFVLPVGIDVTGLVVDERQLPVANADIVLVAPRDGWLAGRIVATAGADGTFAIRAVEPTWSLGALASGYAPSELVDLEAVEPPIGTANVHVRLRLTQPGASVVGTVVDESGNGIAGALLVLGRSGGGGERKDGRVLEHWGPRAVTTDTHGAFRCDGVAPGHQRIAARAPGRARVANEVHCIAGQATAVTLTLLRAVAVEGTVRDEYGANVADAIVMALDDPTENLSIDFALSVDLTELKRAQTRSDALGHFRLDGVAPGVLHLIAAKRRDRSQFDGVAQVTMPALPGDALTWHAVLVAGKQIRARVVDADGKPWWGQLAIHAEQPAGAASYLSVLPERKTGLFVFTDCADVPYTIVARVLRMGSESQWIYLRGIRPGGPEVELRLPAIAAPGAAAAITGRIVDLGQRLDGAPLSVSLCTRAMGRPCKVDGDRFSSDDVPPGRYFVTAHAGQETVLVGPWFELQPSQQLSLGDLNTEPGSSVRITLRGPAGADFGTPIARLDGGFHERSLRWNGSELIADNVTVGRHRVQLAANGWHAAPQAMDVAAGRDNRLVIDVVPGALRRFELTMPLPDRWQHGHVMVRNATGDIIADLLDLTASGIGVGSRMWHTHLPFAELTLVAVIDGNERRVPIDLRGPADEKVQRFSFR